MSNQAVMLELERVLKGEKPPKRIEIFFSQNDGKLYIDNPVWKGAKPPGGVLIGNVPGLDGGPVGFDPEILGGWRVVKE